MEKSKSKKLNISNFITQIGFSLCASLGAWSVALGAVSAKISPTVQPIDPSTLVQGGANGSGGFVVIDRDGTVIGNASKYAVVKLPSEFNKTGKIGDVPKGGVRRANTYRPTDLIRVFHGGGKRLLLGDEKYKDLKIAVEEQISLIDGETPFQLRRLFEEDKDIDIHWPTPLMAFPIIKIEGGVGKFTTANKKASSSKFFLVPKLPAGCQGQEGRAEYLLPSGADLHEVGCTFPESNETYLVESKFLGLPNDTERATVMIHERLHSYMDNFHWLEFPEKWGDVIDFGKILSSEGEENIILGITKGLGLVHQVSKRQLNHDWTPLSNTERALLSDYDDAVRLIDSFQIDKLDRGIYGAFESSEYPARDAKFKLGINSKVGPKVELSSGAEIINSSISGAISMTAGGLISIYRSSVSQYPSNGGGYATLGANVQLTGVKIFSERFSIRNESTIKDGVFEAGAFDIGKNSALEDFTYRAWQDGDSTLIIQDQAKVASVSLTQKSGYYSSIDPNRSPRSVNVVLAGQNRNFDIEVVGAGPGLGLTIDSVSGPLQCFSYDSVNQGIIVKGTQVIARSAADLSRLCGKTPK